MKGFVYKFSSCLAALTASQAAGTTAWAQSATSIPETQAATSAADPGLTDIVVTAQRREERAQTVPVAVSAFGGESLARANADTIGSLSGQVPSLVIQTSGAAIGLPAIGLRGISVQSSELGATSGIGILVDGIPLAFGAGAMLDAFDVERIEVLRGPQGTLFGRNTTGGAISVVRSRPDPNDPFSGKFRATIGSFNRVDLEGVVSGPIIDGVLAAKLSIVNRKDNGQYRNIAIGGRDGDIDFQNYTTTLNFTPGDRFSIATTYDRQVNDSEIPPYVQTYSTTTNTTPVPGYITGRNGPCFNPFMGFICETPRNRRETVELGANPDRPYFKLHALTNEMRYAGDDLTFVSLTGFRSGRQASTNYFDSTRFNLFGINLTQKFRQFSQEARVETNFDGPFNIVAGGLYLHSFYHAAQRVSLDRAAISAIAPGGSFLNSSGSYDTKQWTDSYALFAQANYEISDGLTIIVGGRQTWDKKKIDFINYLAVPGTQRDYDILGPRNTATVKSAQFSKFTPKIGLDYKFAPDQMLYASYSRGYNTGGFNGRPASADLVGPYEPEVMDAYEIGFKSEFFNRRLRFNISAYHNTLKNKQEDILFCNPSTGFCGTTTVNAAKARYKGVDVEIAAAPARGLTLTGSAGYLDAKYASFNGNLGQGFADLSVLKLRRAPKWTAGLNADYERDLGSGKVGFNANVSYLSKMALVVINDPRYFQPATAKVDLAMRYVIDVAPGTEVQLSAFVKNLTDRTNITFVSSGQLAGTFIDSALFEYGRTWGASMQVKF